MPKLPRSFREIQTSVLEYIQSLSIERDVLILYVIALVLNVAVWLLGRAWFYFNPLFALFGLGSVGTTVALGLVFAKKEKMIVQALAVTAVVVQILLLILVLRTGVFSV